MSSQPWCFEHCLYKSSPRCDHSAVVMHFQFTQNTKYIFAFSQHDKIHVVGPIPWIVYLGWSSYFRGCFSYNIPVILQYTYIETGCFVIREFMKKRYSIRTTNPGFARKERRKNGKQNRLPWRKHFSFFARKNELSTFNDRYLHCDTNRVLGLNIRYRSIYNEFR